MVTFPLFSMDVIVSLFHCMLHIFFLYLTVQLFCRSCPRPPVEMIQQSVSDSSRLYPLEVQKPSKPGHGRHGSQSFVPEPSPNDTSSNGFLKRSTNRNVLPVTQTYAENIRHEFSDAATSSDWSLFTSSDEASFTTESTRDSFSTVDYGDSSNMDPISSLFNYTPDNNSYMKFSHSRSLTRFFPQKGHIGRVHRIDHPKDVSNSSIEYPPNGNCGMFVNYGSNPMCGITRTSS